MQDAIAERLTKSPGAILNIDAQRRWPERAEYMDEVHGGTSVAEGRTPRATVRSRARLERYCRKALFSNILIAR